MEGGITGGTTTEHKFVSTISLRQEHLLISGTSILSTTVHTSSKRTFSDAVEDADPEDEGLGLPMLQRKAAASIGTLKERTCFMSELKPNQVVGLASKRYYKKEEDNMRPHVLPVQSFRVGKL